MCTFGPNKTFCLHIINIGRVIYKSDLKYYNQTINKGFSNRVERKL